jgi:3-methyladenine DNA glycosylase/8-oxoguanine DNA glycosylase
MAGVELVDSTTYRRSIYVDGCAGEVEVDLASASVDGRVLFATSSGLDPESLKERVGRLVDFDAPVQDIVSTLAPDRALRPWIRTYPGVRVPGTMDSFELAVRAILGQQVSVTTATTLATRVSARYGRRADLPRCPLLFPTPGQLAGAMLEEVGVSPARARAIRDLAEGVASEGVVLDPAGNIGRSRQQLLAIRGVGPWTAAYVALRGLGDRDSIPETDLGLVRAFGVERPEDLAARSAAWTPYRGYAAVYAWSTYLSL